MLFLLTNDDGISAKGLMLLEARLREDYEKKGRARIVTVAPQFPQSGASRALTVYRPLRCNEIEKDRFQIDGTPVDCVHFALKLLLKSEVTFLISGINNGPNLGDDIAYSGTVGAALEAARMGIPSLALSLVFDKKEIPDFSNAVEFGIKAAELMISNPPQKGVAISANIPQGKIKGIKITKPGRRIYSDRIEVRKDPFGKNYYWMAGDGTLSGVNDPGTDFEALNSNCISISPLDSNCFASYTELELWKNL